MNIKHLAKLANLELTEAEMVKFQDQLTAIMTYIDKLSKLDTSEVEPVSQVTGKVNTLRPDTVTPSLNQAEALKNAQRQHNGFFVTKIEWK